METETPRELSLDAAQQLGYRGRVRSGCQTCRSRKVKCGEQRPICNNCARLKRHCVYAPRVKRQPEAVSRHEGVILEKNRFSDGGPAQEMDSVSPAKLSPLSQEQACSTRESDPLSVAADASWGDPLQSSESPFTPDTSSGEATLQRNAVSIRMDDTQFINASTSVLISRDIQLTTTIDFLATHEAPLRPAFSFFIQAVECPAITPYDMVNWHRMKTFVVELGTTNAAVATAILAVEALYRTQLYALPSTKAVSIYHASRATYEKLLDDTTQDFSTIIIISFLLCLFEAIHYDMVSVLRDPSELFIHRLASWSKQESPHSPLSLRIVAWLRLLHATAIRAGGPGLLSETVRNLLPRHDEGTPNLRPPPDEQMDVPTSLYEILSAPIFNFYLELQRISSDVAMLTHYHRSRTTGADQEEVVQQMTLLKSRLYSLWEHRSAAECQHPQDLRAHLAPDISEPIITLIEICAAAYYTEIVEMGRVLGDPQSSSTESKQATRRIRDIVDSGCSASSGGKISSGYLRPLFLYAIESMDREEAEWAVERLERIKDPICRSDFFASFAKALLDAQLSNGRRVTSRYFCERFFGVSPPFM
ncbi:Sterol uptake control protein 2 [Tolypocladium ophioglossoides CBS 100239]|uniref:Sterol uptake control protein 2 n=1 Tax=Tolypocladium ophioglossoides (strain CBS 100239) TaxID=1163406 RepID=A0A0L0MWS7_TOLOC|nr:Sterol uptake control protein 2 [Tolypocladium ophioglossoides CBS 100239]